MVSINGPPTSRLSSTMTAFIWSNSNSEGTLRSTGTPTRGPHRHRDRRPLVVPSPHQPRVAPEPRPALPACPAVCGTARSPLAHPFKNQRSTRTTCLGTGGQLRRNRPADRWSKTYRDWLVLERWLDLKSYSVKPSCVLERKRINLPYVASPEFGSPDEARKWVDACAPLTLLRE